MPINTKTQIVLETPRGVAVPFRMDVNGFPSVASGLKLINDSILTILSTTVGERVHRPTFGSFLKHIIFEPINRVTALRAKSEIRRALAAWEPRVSVQEIKFTSPKEGQVVCHVTWIVNGSLQGTTNVPVTFSTEA